MYARIIYRYIQKKKETPINYKNEKAALIKLLMRKENAYQKGPKQAKAAGHVTQAFH